MFSRAFLGFPKNLFDSPCIYCDVDIRNLGDFENYYTKTDLGKKYAQIIDCSKVHFIPDTLHLTMRITSCLFEKTLQKIETIDTTDDMLRSQLYDNMAKYGIYKETNITTFLGRECWQLMFNIRNILEPFEQLDKKIIHLWEIQRSLLHKLSSFGKWSFDNIEEYKAELNEWKSTYINLFTNTVSSPYIHIFAVHITEFLERYGALGKFSMQAIENKNKKIKQSYKKSNYRYNNINDWRNQILRIDWLRLNVLFGNKASSIRPHEPYINKKKETIFKRKRFF